MRLTLSDFPLKRLRLLAEYGGFEQNAYWHRRLAKVYRDAAYVNAAIKEFSISIKMDDQDYVAQEGMAFCYEKRKDYLSAIEWDYKALAALPQESKVEKARILQQISGWKTLLEDSDGAIETSHAVYSLSPQDVDASIAYLSALEHNFRFQAILDFAAKLETMDSAQEGENMLTFLFMETWGRAHDIIGNAARRLGRIDTVEQPMRDALAAVERRKSPRGLAFDYDFQYCLLGWADFLNRYADKMDEAVEVYETALERLPKQTTRYGFSSLRLTFKDRLCQLYYHKAKAAECAGTHFDHWVSKLEGLAKTSNAQSVQDVSASEDSSLMLGLWYRLHGREQEAKLCFRTQILNGIDILTDDDPENDLDGYMTLAHTLLKAGDRENAGAAFAVTIAPLDRLKDRLRAAQRASDVDEASREKTIRVPLHSIDAATSIESPTSSMEKPETKGPEEKIRVANNDADDNAIAPDDRVDIDSVEMTTQVRESDEYFTWSCDGNCKRRDEDWQELHFCEICTESTCFCDECIKLVKTGTLPFRKCDISHTFYQAYPLSEEMQDVATVRTGSKIIPRTEWLEALRKEWVA